MSDYPESLQKFAIPPASKNMAGRKSGNKTVKASKVDEETRQKIAEELDQLAKQGVISHGNKSPYTDEATAASAPAKPMEFESKPETEDLDPFSVETGLRQEPVRKLMMQTPPELSEAEKYLSGSKRVSFELADGTFSVAVTDVIESRLSLLVLLPLNESSTVFVPKPGTQIVVSFDGKSVRVYYPGTYAEVPELKTGFMSLIKADSED